MKSARGMIGSKGRVVGHLSSSTPGWVSIGGGWRAEGTRWRGIVEGSPEVLLDAIVSDGEVVMRLGPE